MVKITIELDEDKNNKLSEISKINKRSKKNQMLIAVEEFIKINHRPLNNDTTGIFKNKEDYLNSKYLSRGFVNGSSGN